MSGDKILTTTDLSLGPLRISMEELRYVGHDGLLIWTLNIHILGVKKLGNSKLTVRDNEGGFQSDFVAHMAHGLNVDQAWGRKYFLSSHLIFFTKIFISSHVIFLQTFSTSKCL